jgi:hypothetical protein
MTLLFVMLVSYVGISRVGAVSLSWPTDGKIHNNFEVTQWYKKWLGVYLVLALHVHGGRNMSQNMFLFGFFLFVLNTMLLKIGIISCLNNERRKICSFGIVKSFGCVWSGTHHLF